jgi:hypothetical protein
MAMPDAVCNLHTGLQGHGKTLLTLHHVEKLRIETGRKVFYSGIRELTLDWEEFGAPSADKEKPWFTDPSKWYELPDGAIIVIDEAQRLFRPRGTGAAVPPYESAMETLRHKGHTLFLITQMPKLVSSHVRSLSGVHRHVMRKFGSSWVTMHEWAGVRDNCDKSRKDSMETQLRFPKALFSAYKSAEIHTVKFSVPWKLWALLLLPLVAIAGFWWIFYGRESARKVVPASPAVNTSLQAQTGSASASGGSGRDRAPQTVQSLYASFQPRIAGLPFTASRYDALTDPVRVPVIVGCWQSASAGFCFTQQGTRIALPRDVAAAFIEAGQFVDFEPGGSFEVSSAGGKKSVRDTGAGNR